MVSLSNHELPGDSLILRQAQDEDSSRDEDSSSANGSASVPVFPPPAYAELQVTSNFSFLRGASHPEELARAAKALGLAAIALTDRNSLAGVVRAHAMARTEGVRFIPGARLDFRCGRSLLALPTDRAAYGRLSRLITLGRRRAPKGECHLDLEDLLADGEGLVLIALPTVAAPALADLLAALKAGFPGNAYLAAQHLAQGDDERRIAELAALAARAGVPLVASNDVHYHAPGRRALQDVLTCIREHCTIEEAGFRLFANAERHLKSPAEMERLFAAWPEAVARTLEIADRCRFSLDELRYEYPDEITTEGRTPQEELVHLAWTGAVDRYPGGVPDKVRKALDYELALIAELDYAPYFLTVYDIVRFARSKDILCQGRGSAANSSICYCLGVTAVDPAHHDLLFERFISAARNEPPDIDVDFEHERREEVIQYIYGKYGRDRAGLAATVICYRSRSALREVGKAMGLSLDIVGALAGQIWGRSPGGLDAGRLREIGLDPRDRRLARALELAEELTGFPRHLSQHVGGFVISRGPLAELVPIENAAMAERTVIEWDKDDLMALGLMKVDVLALGMLTCIAKAFALLKRHYGKDYDLATIPQGDPEVYEMLSHADSLGVFQVESRAQMTMLPRLKPKKFYDLVIEVAIVRPGPIQGDMVHPYLRRREGKETVTYPSEVLKGVLEKTLGVPLFQEQAMRIAIEGAGFAPDEADRLRRAMATFKRVGTIQNFRRKFIEGMVARDYERDFAERCFRQIEGFGEYGFPESHAASFAVLVYVSAWLKCHHPAIFACALLNSQPMGFYAPAQIIRDAVEHGVELLPVDVNLSEWDCTLELAAPKAKDDLMVSLSNHEAAASRLILRPSTERPHPELSRRRGPSAQDEEAQDEALLSRPGYRHGTAADGFALRLGLRQVKGIGEAEATALVEARGNGYGDPLMLWRRAGLTERALRRLAHADAFRSQGLDRRQALWALKGLPDKPLPLFAAMQTEEQGEEEAVTLPAMTLGQHVAEDYASLRLSLKAHPMALLRARMTALDYRSSAELA
ncbi:MAG: error-prone DNA polymerase, partial [Hyphomicrobium sp.]|uniref:error-prone DNA polymerase n=1 Tax=Hyphomicrobium sp. TaxID=82 RepID=UPI003D102CB0